MSRFNNETNYTRFDPAPGTGAFTHGPRFGHLSDFASAFEGKEEAKDYVIGLIFAGAIMAALFLVWALFLIVLKCMGQKQVGFLSGAQFRQPKPETESVKAASDEDPDNPEKHPEQEQEPSSQCACSRPLRLRIVFFTSGVIFVLFTILLVTQGLTNLQSTVDTVDFSAAEVESLAEDAQDILNSGLKDVGDVAKDLRTVVVEELEDANFCPADPDVQNSDIAQEIVEHGDTAVQLLDALEDFSLEDIQDIEKTIERVRKGAAQAQQETEKIKFNDWRVILVITIYMLIPAVLMAACLLAFFDVSVPWFSCIIAYFFTPIFILLVLFAWIVASGIVIAAGANGDFCLPGGRPDENTPDTTILQVLDVYGYTEEQNPLVYEVITYYIRQCTSDNPFAFLREYVSLIDAGLDGVEQLDSAVNTEGVLEELSLYCNRDFTKFVSVLENMKSVLIVLGRAAIDSLDLVSCDRIVPIYTATIYDGTCNYSINAMLWCFSCCLILGFFGMLMLTFRSAYKPTIYEDEEEENNEILDAKVTRELDNENDDYSDDEYEEQPGEEHVLEVDVDEVLANSDDDDVYTDDDHSSGFEASPRRLASARVD